MAKVTERNSILKAKIEAANAKVQRAEEAAEAAELSQKKINQEVRERIAKAEPKTLDTVEEVGPKLAHALTQAIVNQKSTLFISSTGIGKTDRFLEELAQVRRDYKVLVVMQSHALINQSFLKFKSIQQRLQQQEQIPVTWFDRSEARTFAGKAVMCDKLNILRKRAEGLGFDEKCFDTNVRELKHKPIPQIDKRDCEDCFLEECAYSEQFNVFHENIRFMTVNELYNEPSFFNKLQGRTWVPDLIIVDDHTLSTDTIKLYENDFTEGLKQFCRHVEEQGTVSALDYYQFWLKKDAADAANKIKANKEIGTPDALQENNKLQAVREICNALVNAEKSCVRMHDRFEYTKLHRIHDRFKKCTVIWFDGTANKEVFKAVYPDAEVEEFHAQKKDLVKHIQVKNRSFSQGTLTNEVNLRTVVDWMAAECITHEFKKVGVITYMSISGVDGFAIAVSEDLKKCAGVQTITAHFGNTRGSNEFEDCDAIFVIGRHMLPPQAIQGYSLAVHGSECEVDLERTWEAVRFKDEQGLRYEPIYSTRYIDPVAESIHQHFAVAETLQAVGRGRAYHSTKARSVYIFSNQCLGANTEINEFRDLYLPNDERSRAGLLSEKSEEVREKIAETQRIRGQSTFSAYVNILKDLNEIEDTKAAFEDIGVALSVAKDKARRKELAQAAGFSLVEVQTQRSQGRKAILKVWKK